MMPIAAAILVVFPQLEAPGTQPGELTNDIVAPSLCAGCHGGYAEYAATETWQGSMMANAMRDPLYLAALTVANQDIPGSGELCIRCHSPRGWLFGRAQPTDGSALQAGDYEGVSCDFCHRMTEGPAGERYIGNGQFFVANDTARRGTLMDARSSHAWVYSEYHTTSELCGVCHDVSNPLQNDFAIERTYTEWANSAFKQEGVTCQECHTPKEDQAYASVPGNVPERSTGRHDLVGGNSWMPLVLAGEYPELGRQAAFEYTANRALEMLRSSAKITFRQGDREIAPGETPSASTGGSFDITVRVENLTGHKLPTGYPEGRRSWLEVKIVAMDGTTVYHSGAYDLQTSTRADDPDLRTYEVKLAAGGQEGFHFVLTDEILQDNRIPPRGFTPTPQTTPVGREYPMLEDGTLAYWDDATYRISIPSDTVLGPATVTATMWYQTTSREYVEFLRNENVTDTRGEYMYSLWQQYGKAPPVDMVTATLDIQIQEGSGCACQVQAQTKRSSPVPWMLGLALLWVAHLRKRALGHVC